MMRTETYPLLHHRFEKRQRRSNDGSTFFVVGNFWAL